MNYKEIKRILSIQLLLKDIEMVAIKKYIQILKGKKALKRFLRRTV